MATATRYHKPCIHCGTTYAKAFRSPGRSQCMYCETTYRKRGDEKRKKQTKENKTERVKPADREGKTVNQLLALGFTHYCRVCYKSFGPDSEPCDCGAGLRRL